MKNTLIIFSALIMASCGSETVTTDNGNTGEFGADGKTVEKTYSLIHEVSEVTDKATLVFMQDTCLLQDDSISNAIGNIYGQLYQNIVGIAQKELCMAPISFMGPIAENWSIKAGLVIEDTAGITGPFMYEPLYNGRVIKTYYYGPYTNLETGYAEAAEFLADGNYEANGAAFDEYVTDPTPDVNPDSILTVIYQPIK